MFETDNDHRARRLSPNTWLRLAMLVALILLLAGCGTGGTADSSGQEDAGSGDEPPEKTKTVSPDTQDSATKSGKTERASSDDGELGTPALGDSGAPVVMVEYADYQ